MTCKNMQKHAKIPRMLRVSQSPFAGQCLYSTQAAMVKEEPVRPNVVTEVPGPKTKQLIQDLDKIQVQLSLF